MSSETRSSKSHESAAESARQNEQKNEQKSEQAAESKMAQREPNPQEGAKDKDGFLEKRNEMSHDDERIREARNEKFTTREIDLDHNEADKQAMRDAELAKVPEWKRAEVVASAKEGSLHTRELQTDEKLYRFDSSKQPDGKNPGDKKSCYWTDEQGYSRMKENPECYDKEKQQWKSDGVKNNLALPCSNRADCVVEARVDKSHTAAESTIAPAKENLYYRDDKGEIHQGSKEMKGGEQQVTPDAAQVKDGHVVWKKGEKEGVAKAEEDKSQTNEAQAKGDAGLAKAEETKAQTAEAKAKEQEGSPKAAELKTRADQEMAKSDVAKTKAVESQTKADETRVKAEEARKNADT